MKINLKIFSKTSSLLALLSSGGTGYTMNPVRVWTISLLVGTICFLIGVAFIAFDFYTQISQSPQQDMSIEVQPITYRARDVIRYAEQYTEKATMFSTLRSEKTFVPPVVDVETAHVDSDVETFEPLADELEEQYTDPVPGFTQ